MGFAKGRIIGGAVRNKNEGLSPRRAALAARLKKNGMRTEGLRLLDDNHLFGRAASATVAGNGHDAVSRLRRRRGIDVGQPLSRRSHTEASPPRPPCAFTRNTLCDRSPCAPPSLPNSELSCLIFSRHCWRPRTESCLPIVDSLTL